MPDTIRWRGIHLDLKGAPLPIGVLLDEIRKMAGWGINLLLIEYEDTFPYAFDPTIRAATAYTPDDISRIVSTCKSLNVEIVPLVQTFGHLEYVLKHTPYQHLAQTAGSLQSIDPTLPEGRQIVLTMIDEFLAAHPTCRWLHLGGDEVWDLGEGERSKPRAEQIGKDALYLEHMMPIVEHVLSRGIRPIIWDDMMRHWPIDSLRKIAAKADLMPWAYEENPFARIHQESLDNFHAAGARLWAAAAFKGADGITADLPNDRVRMSNMQAWARCVVENNWEGMVATGWSRYNGLATYCELWQAAPMTLYLAAEVMRKGFFEPDDWDKACHETIGITGLPQDWATNSKPRKMLDELAGADNNPALQRLKAVAAVAQWRRQAQFYLDVWLSSGGFEDSSRRSDHQVTNTVGKWAKDLVALWDGIQQEFTQAMQPVLHARDIADYLASRRRMGVQYVQPLLSSR